MKITCPEFEFVAEGIQHKMRMRYVFICDLPGSNFFFFAYYLINGTILGNICLNTKGVF